MEDPISRWVRTRPKLHCSVAHGQARVSWLQMRALGLGFGQGMLRQLRYQRLRRGKIRPDTRGIPGATHEVAVFAYVIYVFDGKYVTYYVYCELWIIVLQWIIVTWRVWGNHRLQHPGETVLSFWGSLDIMSNRMGNQWECTFFFVDGDRIVGG